MMMCIGPGSFKVGMQGLTAQSTMEAELVAAALATRKAVVFPEHDDGAGLQRGVQLRPATR